VYFRSTNKRKRCFMDTTIYISSNVGDINALDWSCQAVDLHARVRRQLPMSLAIETDADKKAQYLTHLESWHYTHWCNLTQWQFCSVILNDIQVDVSRLLKCKKTTNSLASSPQANYTDRTQRLSATKLVLTVAGRGCCVVSTTHTYDR
jgi:hypothetical protein